MRPGSPRRADGGFTLIEVLVAMVIMAIAIFPSLEIIREAQKNSFDAKFAELCAGKARSLLSEITRAYMPGNSGSGDLSSLAKEEGGDDRDSFANIKYEWQCSSVDLSLDVTPASDMSDADKDANTKKQEQQDKAQSDEAADAAIDERFRSRYVRIMFTYKLDSGEERQIILETYVPPFPTDNPNNANGNDSVQPNNGAGGTSGGLRGGGSGKGASGKGGSGKGGSSSGKAGGSGSLGGKSGNGGKKGN